MPNKGSSDPKTYLVEEEIGLSLNDMKNNIALGEDEIVIKALKQLFYRFSQKV